VYSGVPRVYKEQAGESRGTFLYTPPLCPAYILAHTVCTHSVHWNIPVHTVVNTVCTCECTFCALPISTVKGGAHGTQSHNILPKVWCAHEQAVGCLCRVWGSDYSVRG